MIDVLKETNIKGLKVAFNAACNMNCKYCYLAKSEALAKIDEQISDSYDKLFEVAKQVDSLTIWGAEPSLVLEKVSEYIKRMDKVYWDIYYSTNMLTDPKVYVRVLRNFNGKTRKVRHQISLDGPEWLNFQRSSRAVEKVVEHTKRFVELMNNVDIDYQLIIDFKPTWDAMIIEYLAHNLEKVREWYDWFDKLLIELRSLCTNKNVLFPRVVVPSLAVPGKYTKQDGINYSAVVRETLCIGQLPGHFTKLCDMWSDSKLGVDLSSANMECSAGKNGLGYDRGYFGLCHRTYYFDDDEYISDLVSKGYDTNWWTSTVNWPSVINIRKYFLPKDKYGVIRMLYVAKGCHYYLGHRIATGFALAKMLAKTGQISKIYWEDDNMAQLLSLIVNVFHGCISEWLINTGSVNVPLASYFKLYGNGALEYVVENFDKLIEAYSNRIVRG